MTAAPAPALIDELLPRFDEVERHELVVRAPAPAVYAALRRVDLLGPRVVRWLILLRGLPSALSGPRRRRPRGPVTLERLLESGFVLLGERAGRELALGIAGRFWRPAGERLALDADGFRAFDRPGHAKAVWTFSLEEQADGTTRLVTETRIQCLDRASRRRFRLYWRLVRPFSGLIRIALLRAIAREALRPRR
ncbi:MAG: hypothetical protein HY727_04170 [Candidatus Rokubacteria bacterium]|nr:hypothetical protein [Candidatus Rokubacteria bacterium]